MTGVDVELQRVAALLGSAADTYVSAAHKLVVCLEVAPGQELEVERDADGAFVVRHRVWDDDGKLLDEQRVGTTVATADEAAALVLELVSEFGS